MDPKDFYDGLKTEDEQFSEQVAGAEHFVRLKKQTGLQDQEQGELLGDLDLDKVGGEIESVVGVDEGSTVEDREEEKMRLRFRKAIEKRAVDYEAGRTGLMAALGAAGGAYVARKHHKGVKELDGKSLPEATQEKVVGLHRQMGENKGFGAARREANLKAHEFLRKHPKLTTIGGALAGTSAGYGLGRYWGGKPLFGR